MNLAIGKHLSIIAMLVIGIPAEGAEGTKAPGANRQPTILDVALTNTGEFQGAVVGKDGRPLAGQAVHFLAKSKVIAVAKTDFEGRYVIKGLRNGLHQVNTKHGQQVCRVWTQSAAPPTARKGLITVKTERLTRGQNGGYVGIGGREILGLGVFGATTAATLISTLHSDNSTSADLKTSSAGGLFSSNDSGSGSGNTGSLTASP